MDFGSCFWDYSQLETKILECFIVLSLFYANFGEIASISLEYCIFKSNNSYITNSVRNSYCSKTCHDVLDSFNISFF